MNMRLTFVALLLLIAQSSYAEYDKEDYGSSAYERALEENDYDANYYKDESKLLFKVRAFGIVGEGKHKSLPNPIVTPSVNVSSLTKDGYGADTSTTIFYNRYVGAELSLGLFAFRTKRAALVDIQNNYAGNAAGKRKDIYMIPLTLTAQYHIAPYGAIRPYIGLGYYGGYLFTRSKDFKVKNTHGAVFQAGVDFVAKDDTFITVDIKKYTVSPTVIYKQGFLPGQNVRSKLKIDPLIISAGIGFAF